MPNTADVMYSAIAVSVMIIAFGVARLCTEVGDWFRSEKHFTEAQVEDLKSITAERRRRGQ